MTLYCRDCGKQNAYGWDYGIGSNLPPDILPCGGCGRPVVDHLTLLASLGLCHPTVMVCTCGGIGSIGSRHCFRCGRPFGP